MAPTRASAKLWSKPFFGLNTLNYNSYNLYFYLHYKYLLQYQYMNTEYDFFTSILGMVSNIVSFCHYKNDSRTPYAGQPLTSKPYITAKVYKTI